MCVRCIIYGEMADKVLRGQPYPSASAISFNAAGKISSNHPQIGWPCANRVKNVLPLLGYRLPPKERRYLKLNVILRSAR
jgi:hypothetical protein